MSIKQLVSAIVLLSATAYLFHVLGVFGQFGLLNPAVEGTVISAHGEETYSGFRTADETIYDLKLRYRYDVNGVTYYGEQVRGTKVYRRGEIRDLQREYDYGKTVKVFYDVDSPNSSYVSIGGVPDLSLYILATIFLLISGVAFNFVRR